MANTVRTLYRALLRECKVVPKEVTPLLIRPQLDTDAWMSSSVHFGRVGVRESVMHMPVFHAVRCVGIHGIVSVVITPAPQELALICGVLLQQLVVGLSYTLARAL